MVWLLPIISLLVLQKSAAQIGMWLYSYILLTFKYFFGSVFTAAPSDVLVAVGSSAQFSCQATSSNSLSIVWRKGSAVITPSARFTISLTGLTINPTQTGDEGTYTCTATDQVLQTSESRSAMLTFASKLTLLRTCAFICIASHVLRTQRLSTVFLSVLPVSRCPKATLCSCFVYTAAVFPLHR